VFWTELVAHEHRNAAATPMAAAVDRKYLELVFGFILQR
jgi:hypothetical protein